MRTRSLLSSLFALFSLSGCAGGDVIDNDEAPIQAPEIATTSTGSEEATAVPEGVGVETPPEPACSSEDAPEVYYACAEPVVPAPSLEFAPAPSTVDSRIVPGGESDGDPFPSDDYAGSGLPGISRDLQLIAMPQAEGDAQGVEDSMVLLNATDASVARLLPIASTRTEDPDDDASTPEGARRARREATRVDRALVRGGYRSLPALPMAGENLVEGLPVLVWHRDTLMVREAGPGRILWRGALPLLESAPLRNADGSVYVSPCDYSRPTGVDGWMLPDGGSALLRLTTKPPGDECGVRLEYQIVPLERVSD